MLTPAITCLQPALDACMHAWMAFQEVRQLLTAGMSRRLDQSPVVGRAKPPGRGIFCPFASRMSPPVANAFLFFWSISILGSIWISGLGFLPKKFVSPLSTCYLPAGVTLRHDTLSDTDTALRKAAWKDS